MVTINYQAYGGSKQFRLRLRFYKDGETKYINVSKFLTGNLLKRHWNTRAQVFRDSAPFSTENNRFLFDFKKTFADKAADWNGTLSEFMLSFDKNNPKPNNEKTLKRLFELMIEEKKARKHPDGTTKGTFELYAKTERRVIEFCADNKISYEEILVENIEESTLNNFFDWAIKKGIGYVYCSMALHALFMKADKMGWFDFSKIKNCKWQGKYGASKHKHETLTKQQCQRFANLKIEELPPCKYAELYRDFCLFMLCTGQSPCDAISLNYSQVKYDSNGSYLDFKRRKISEKQTQPCNVPINAEMQRIMDKYKYLSKDGYIFPIRNKKTMKHSTNNYDIKKFVQKLNVWLKKVGKILGCNYPLHSYVFRHTAITGWIAQGVDLIYVANTAGTSVKNCESIYYDNLNDTRNCSRFMTISNY